MQVDVFVSPLITPTRSGYYNVVVPELKFSPTMKDNLITVETIDDSKTLKLLDPRFPPLDQFVKVFKFDHIFDPSTQPERIISSGFDSYIDASFDRERDAYLILFGQTLTGKSHLAKLLVPLVFRCVFFKRKQYNRQSSLRLTVVEISNDSFIDRGGDTRGTFSPLFSGHKMGHRIRDVTFRKVSCVDDVVEIISRVNTGNSGHMLYTVHVSVEGKSICSVSVVDLVGTGQAKTYSRKDHAKSLSALKQCIMELSRKRKSHRHIPFRSSPLTRFLKDSLSGNTLTSFLICISPEEDNYDESLSILKYAKYASKIRRKNHPSPTRSSRSPEEINSWVDPPSPIAQGEESRISDEYNVQSVWNEILKRENLEKSIDAVPGEQDQPSPLLDNNAEDSRSVKSTSPDRNVDSSIYSSGLEDSGLTDDKFEVEESAQDTAEDIKPQESVIGNQDHAEAPREDGSQSTISVDSDFLLRMLEQGELLQSLTEAVVELQEQVRQIKSELVSKASE